MDMILLSHADILIASRMSSFVQTMPMSLVFGRSDGKIAKPNCELNFEASKMICSSSYLEWCCNISQSEIRPTFLKESLKFPPLGGLNMSLFKPQDRPFHLKEGKDTYLPLYWRTRCIARRIFEVNCKWRGIVDSRASIVRSSVIFPCRLHVRTYAEY